MKHSWRTVILQAVIVGAIATVMSGCKPSNDAGKTGVGSMKAGDATDSALGSSSTTPVAPSTASGAGQ